MYCINRKKMWIPSYNDGSASVNHTERFIDEPVNVNGVDSRVTAIQRVDMSLVDPLPTADEFDLETQLKAGVKPQLINVRGILGTDFDVADGIGRLRRFVEENDKKSVEPIKPVEPKEPATE